MYPTGMHVHILHNAVEKHAQVFMIPSQMISLTQFFYGFTTIV